jgi:hypothetical protein
MTEAPPVLNAVVVNIKTYIFYTHRILKCIAHLIYVLHCSNRKAMASEESSKSPCGPTSLSKLRAQAPLSRAQAPLSWTKQSRREQAATKTYDNNAVSTRAQAFSQHHLLT